MSINIEKLRDLLVKRQQELQTLVSSEAADTVELDQTRVGRLSRMDALQSQQMALESKRRAQADLARVSAALTRCIEDEYGFCEECDEEINPARLEIDPAITLCITCANKLEKVK